MISAQFKKQDVLEACDKAIEAWEIIRKDENEKLTEPLILKEMLPVIIFGVTFRKAKTREEAIHHLTNTPSEDYFDKYYKFRYYSDRKPKELQRIENIKSAIESCISVNQRYPDYVTVTLEEQDIILLKYFFKGGYKPIKHE